MLAKEHNWTPNRYRHGWIPLDGIIAKHKATGVHIEASESASSGALRLHMISVAPAQRGKGSASAAMRDLTAYADQKGIPMALSPEAHGAGGLTTAALRRWYQRFGFVPNKGRKADLSISESMIRQPIAKQTVSTGSSTGQTVTLNMNTTRLRAYRKLRQKGLPHHQALAMAKRVRMAKASAWNPAQHPRASAGTAQGGQFITAGQNSAGASKASKLMGHGGKPLTKAQIMAYQKKHKLKVDGLIGRQTAAKLLGQKAQAPGALTAGQKRALGLAKPKRTTPPAPANAPGITTHPRARMAKAAHAPYAALHPPIVHHGSNWVSRRGGLPGPIDAIARVLISKGWDEQRAVATAVSQAKKQCATGRAFGGKVPLGGPAHATICAAVAEWEALKASA